MVARPRCLNLFNANIEEDIDQSRNHAFHSRPYAASDYPSTAGAFIRPRNGRQFAEEIHTRGQGKSAKTFLCWHAVTTSHRSVMLFQPYRPWFMVQLEPHESTRQFQLRKLLRGLHKWLGVAEGAVTWREDRTKFPLCGWQPEPSHWFFVSTPNWETRRHLVAVLRNKKRDFKVRMMDRPVNERMRVYLRTGIRPSSHVAVTSGSIVAVAQQISDARIEVTDATLECLHATDNGPQPSPLSMVAMGWDLECTDRQQKGMVNT